MGLERTILENSQATSEQEKKEKELKGLLEIYALYRDRKMLPYQGRDPYVTDDSKTISHRITTLQKEIRSMPLEKPKEYVVLQDD